MKEWGIRARVLFLALAPSIMILLALVIYFTYERIAEVDVSLAERGKLIARRLAPETEFAIFAGDHATLQRLIDAAVHEVDVRGISIGDAQGRELVRSGLPEGAADTETTMRFIEPVIQTRLAVDDFPELSRSVAAPAKVGEIVVVMSRDAARMRQQRLLLTGLALGLAGLIIAMTLAIAIGNGVIHPIRRLAKAMVELGQGQDAVRIPTEGGGELSTLSEGFNRMAARLQADARELEARIGEATRELLVQKETAEQATLAKSRFIASASHDLRQPLHAIGLFSSTLQRRAEGTELQAVIADLVKAVSAMDRLFGSLLDISRLDAGTLQVESRPFPLQRLFDQLAAEYSDTAAQGHLRLHVRRTVEVVVADELLLHRVLSNLVANAIRYTRVGSVVVCCRRRNGMLQIEVRDSGIGIVPDKHQEIFQEFYQISDASADRTGLGLGLAIVSRLARLLGTRVAVRSALGRGSVFSLRLARGNPGTAPGSVDVAQMAGTNAGLTLHVLVVDDDPLVLSGNRALLEELGCAVTTVTDAEQAQASLVGHAADPVLVLCDMWLANGQNGIDLLQRLATLTTAPISSILISGDTRPETMEAASVAGYPLLHKPVSPAKLRAVVMHFAWKVRRKAGTESNDEDPPR
ncbi:MAG: ATP-binding protein [Rudaea sp.]